MAKPQTHRDQVMLRGKAFVEVVNMLKLEAHSDEMWKLSSYIVDILTLAFHFLLLYLGCKIIKVVFVNNPTERVFIIHHVKRFLLVFCQENPSDANFHVGLCNKISSLQHFVLSDALTDSTLFVCVSQNHHKALLVKGWLDSGTETTWLELVKDCGSSHKTFFFLRLGD